jgi:hypothetical protein
MGRVISLLTALILISVSLVFGFDSGSTGADGPFSPTEDTVLQVPEDGIFNFTTINIPAGVTVTFKKNSRNTPVYILATGDVIIEGVISVDGTDAVNQFPGEGGPGGFDGGAGGPTLTAGGNGLGPGGGEGGKVLSQGIGSGGGGGGFGTSGDNGLKSFGGTGDVGKGGSTYGNEKLLPITGGSGGGGGGGCKNNDNQVGGAGGGGGGAIVIASSSTITISGTLTANGGKGAMLCSGGGGGSGGAIRLIADKIIINGNIKAVGGKGASAPYKNAGGNGGQGRIRIEAYSLQMTTQTVPQFIAGRPSSVFVAEVPELRIVEVAGVAVPQNPTGRFGTPDVTLPLGTQNPVPVKIVASKIPTGTVVKLTSTPEHGPVETATGTLTGTFDSSSVTIDINLSTEYQCILTAEATFTMQTTLYFDGEKIDRVRVASKMGNSTEVVYVTESGREVPLREFLAKVSMR